MLPEKRYLILKFHLFAIISHYLNKQSFGEIGRFCQLHWYDKKRNRNFGVELGGQETSNNKKYTCTCIFENSAARGRRSNSSKLFLHP